MSFKTFQNTEAFSFHLINDQSGTEKNKGLLNSSLLFKKCVINSQK